jgi:uncharacterized membrane protein
MPNWSYLLANFAYHLGLALWIGGSIALGALVAPALFKALPRPQAGAIFGPTLRRYSRLRLAALILLLIGAGLKYVRWETHTASVWIGLRWVAIAFLAASLLYEIVFLERAIERRRMELVPDWPADDPRRAAFNHLHRRAEVMMKASLMAAIVALLLS